MVFNRPKKSQDVPENTAKAHCQSVGPWFEPRSGSQEKQRLSPASPAGLRHFWVPCRGCVGAAQSFGGGNPPNRGRFARIACEVQPACNSPAAPSTRRTRPIASKVSKICDSRSRKRPRALNWASRLGCPIGRPPVAIKSATAATGATAGSSSSGGLWHRRVDIGPARGAALAGTWGADIARQRS